MLNFDLTQNPPTVEEIAAERKAVERKIATSKRKVWIASLATFVVAGLTFLTAWLSGSFTGEQAITVFAAFVGVIAGAIASASVCAGAAAGAPASVGVFAGVVAVASASVGAFAIAGVIASASVCAGAVAGASASVCVFAGVRIGRLGESLSVLADIAPADCEQLIAGCLADPDCEAYQQKLSALGRKPVKAEAEMIREWVASKEPLPPTRQQNTHSS